MNIASHADVLRGFVTLSSGEASECCEEAGEKEKESARGTMGRGKREDGFPPFPSSYRPTRAFFFFDYCYFHWDTQREPLRRTEGSSKEGLRGPFLLGQFTSAIFHHSLGKNVEPKRFKSPKFFAFSCKNDKPSHLF